MTMPWAQLPDARPYVPYATDQITIDSTAGGKTLTAANTNGCKRAIISVEVAPIRYVDDGATTVTSSLGLLANVGDQIILIGPEVQNFKAIRTTGTSATLTVEYAR